MNTLSTLLFILFTLHLSYSQDLELQIDDIVSSVYTVNEPGISILVAKDGIPIYRKAIGKSNLELGTSMTPENVFEIGSITKQFTAISVLMLEEQGKLRISDEITKYIPDYPTNGKTITIHHLLNHTSGIKGRTPVGNPNTARTDMTPNELIDYFKNMPMNFDPGEQFRYSNSGYILLGYIIKVVSGQSYEEYIEKNIFNKLGMTSSYFGSTSEIIKNRASGYQLKKGDYINADYLSLTLPYAAGSLMSTVDDLLIWQNAISANSLIKGSSLQKAINPSTLNNGKEIPYGYGWRLGDFYGTEGRGHNGGTFGYTASGIFLPNENIYVIGLANCNCKNAKNVSEVARKVAALAIGQPIPDIKNAISLSVEDLKKWVGTYQFVNNTIRYISLIDGHLFSQREGSQKYKIYPMKDDTFIFEDGMLLYQFSESNDGAKKVIMKNGNKEYLGSAIDMAPPTERKTIVISTSLLKKYKGKYELKPNVNFNITVEGNTLFLQAPGQSKKIELFAERENQFFVKVSTAKITFNTDNKGKINSLSLNQDGQQMLAKKIE
jgi:CubicO group peptidase (beta-lactamase class C family)